MTTLLEDIQLDSKIRTRTPCPGDLKVPLGAAVAEGEEEEDESKAKEKNKSKLAALTEYVKLMDEEKAIGKDKWENTVGLDDAKEKELLDQMLEKKPAILLYDPKNWDSKSIALMCLRGRKYDVDKACASFDRYVGFREQYDLDKPDIEADEDTLVLWQRAFQCFYFSESVDKHGRLIITIFHKNQSPKKCSVYQLCRIFGYMIEQACRSKEVGKNIQVNGVVIIHDFEGYIPTYKKNTNTDVRVFLEIDKALMGRIPLRFGGVHALNSSMLMRFVWAFAKYFFPAKFRERIWWSSKSELLKAFGAEKVLECHGGSLVLNQKERWDACFPQYSKFVKIEEINAMDKADAEAKAKAAAEAKKNKKK